MRTCRIFYVYVYFRPNGIPCYVGQGKNNRWLIHLRKQTNPHLWNIIQNAGGSIPVVKVRENLTWQEAIETEIMLIAAIGREDNGTGPLVNRTDGGDGTVGFNQPKSEEHKKNISLALTGIKFTQEHCDAISTSLKGWKPSPKFIEHLRKIRREQVRPPCSRETAAKIGAGNLGKKRTEEVKAQMSLQRRGRKKSPEHCAAIGRSHEGKKRSQASIAKQKATKALTRDARRARVKAYWDSLTPEQRANRSRNIANGTKEAMKDPAIREKISVARKKSKKGDG